MIKVFFISTFLNVLFSMVGRARNRNNFWYHGTLSLSSNFLWLIFMKDLMSSEISVLAASSVGMTVGSLIGQRVSMFIERKILAKSDDHI